MFDVIVVGAGPAGSAAAKRCAGEGLETLLLEKRILPRDKMCDGMVMGPVPKRLIKQEFGDIPEDVLTQPRSINGYVMHVPGIDSQKVDNFTLLTWRRNLDRWFTRGAEAKGVKVWQGTRVVDVSQKGKVFQVKALRGKETQELETRFIVGADGGASQVRKSLFPEVKVSYSQVYGECYRCDLDLDRTYFHWFYPVEYCPGLFCAHHKDGLLQIDYGGRAGIVREIILYARKYLAKNHGFDLNLKPVWRGGCVQPSLFRDLILHRFLPAKGNALLAGEAGGFVLPISGEGIGTAIRTGLAAGSAIAAAAKSGIPPDSLYLKEIEPVLVAFDELLPWFKKIMVETKAGGGSLARVLADAYSATLRPF